MYLRVLTHSANISETSPVPDIALNMKYRKEKKKNVLYLAANWGG